MVQLILLTAAFCCMTDAYSMGYGSGTSGRGASHSSSRGRGYSGREVLATQRSRTDHPYAQRPQAVLRTEQPRVTKEQLASQLSDMQVKAAIADTRLEAQRQAFIALLQEFNTYKVSMAADLAARPTREEIERMLGTMQEIQQESQQMVELRLNQLQGLANTFQAQHGTDLQQIKQLCGVPIQILQQDQAAIQQEIVALKALAAQQQLSQAEEANLLK